MVGFSTKSRYGLRAMIYLAKNCDQKEVCPLKEVAEAENISLDYLEKIISKLREAGLVKAEKGARGGYYLTKRPGQIRVGEVIRILEKNLAPAECAAGEEKEPCPREEKCDAKEIWQKIKTNLDATLNSFTLADLVNHE